MKRVIANQVVYVLFLSALWIIATGSLTLGNLVLGLLAGVGAMLTLQQKVSIFSGWPRFTALFQLLCAVAQQCLSASVKISCDILSTRPNLSPRVMKIPLAIKSPFGRLLLAHLVTFTPGTIALHIDDQKDELIIYSLYASNTAQKIANITTSFEKPIQQFVGE